MRALLEAGIEIDVFPIYPLDSSLWGYSNDTPDDDVLSRDRIHHLSHLEGLKMPGPYPARKLGVYLRDVALPAMREGAQKAGRPVPPLLAHAPICVHDKPDEIRAAAQQQLANYVRLPFYIKMFEAAGFPEAASGSWSDAMIEAVVFAGDEARVAERIQGMFAIGATEILVSPLVAGSDRTASVERTLRLVAEVAKGMSA